MTATIHFNELESWQARHRAGEIYINGMTVLTEKGSYRLTYTDNNLRGGALVSPTVGSQPILESGQRAVEADDRNKAAGSSPATPTTLSPEPRTSPSSPVGRGVAEVTSAPATIPVVMISCPVCSAVHPENEECWICQKFDRLKHLDKRNRRNYALEKRFGKTP